MDHNGQCFDENHITEAAVCKGVLIDDADHRGKCYLRQTFAIIKPEWCDTSNGHIADGCRDDEFALYQILVAGKNTYQSVGDEYGD